MIKINKTIPDFLNHKNYTMLNLKFLQPNKLLAIIIISVLLVSCKSNDKTKIGEILTNDIQSNKIASLLMAIEAKDSISQANLLAEDFKYFDETYTPWVDNEYFKDTLIGVNKTTWLMHLSKDLQLWDSIKFENPKIVTYCEYNGDTTTNIKSYLNAVSKSNRMKIHLPFTRFVKWKQGEIYQMLAINKHLPQFTTGYSTLFGNTTPDFYGYGSTDMSLYGYTKYYSDSNKAVPKSDSNKVIRRQTGTNNQKIIQKNKNN